MTIVEFLQARYAEREAGARQLLLHAQQTSLALQEPRLLGKYMPGWHDWPDVEAMCESVLRDVEAKRRIVDEYERMFDRRREHREDLAIAGGLLALHGAVKALAAAHDAHPDYDPSWSPA